MYISLTNYKVQLHKFIGVYNHTKTWMFQEKLTHHFIEALEVVGDVLRQRTNREGIVFILFLFFFLFFFLLLLLYLFFFLDSL
jgi:hypothetical protein